MRTTPPSLFLPKILTHPLSFPLGWECHFSLASGQVLPVPAEDLPEALREWEVEMWGWEGTTYDSVR